MAGNGARLYEQGRATLQKKEFPGEEWYDDDAATSFPQRTPVSGNGGGLWLIDTGSPPSFGPDLVLQGKRFRLSSSYLAVTPEALSAFGSERCAGLIAADVLYQFDWILDVTTGTATFSKER